jgi:very-short-patch-repair endonuclease
VSESLNYFSVGDEEKKKILDELYNEKLWSWPMIAEHLGTYTNRICRDAKRLGVATRTKAESQRVALETNRIKHPTKGTKRTTDEKTRIGKKAALRWANMSDAEREKMCQMSRDKWANMTEEEKAAFQAASVKAIQEASKEGSKIEKFVHKGLIRAGYEVHYHKERFVKNERLEVDIFVPQLGVAIEMDGPSHWSPIWGEEAYERVQRSDNQKTGLLIGGGYTLIRVEQRKRLSLTYQNEILSSLLNVLKKIEKGECKDKLIYIGRDD